MLRVLTYHRIADPKTTPDLHPKLASCTPETFARQLDFLLRHYEVVSMADVLAAARGDAPLPPRAVLLTFDDAYRDFLATAWPALRSRRLPAALFVPTAYPGDPSRHFWWDRLHRAVTQTHRRQLEVGGRSSLPLATLPERRATLAVLQGAVKALPHETAMTRLEEWIADLGAKPAATRAVLSWDELRTLATEGVAVCAHTRNHPLLPRLDPTQLDAEVRGSLDDLRRELGTVLPVFAYPSGAHDTGSVEAVRRAGFALAFTQLDGHNDLRRTNLLRLRRTNITRRTTPRLLGLRLQSWFTHIDRWRHRDRIAPRSVREIAVAATAGRHVWS